MPTEDERSFFVHHQGLCESDDVGAGTRIWAFAHVMAGAHVGHGCNIGDHAFIETGAVLGDRVTVKNAVMIFDRVVVEDDVFLGPGMVFTNDHMPRAHLHRGREEFRPTLVRRGASIGANATVVCGVEVGVGAMVGAGSVVTRNVPARALVIGSPARRLGWICDCGTRLANDLTCGCGAVYDLVDAVAGLVRRGSDAPAESVSTSADCSSGAVGRTS